MHASFTYGFFLALGRKRKMSMIYVLWWVLHTLLLPGPTFMRGFLFSVRTWFLSFHVSAFSVYGGQPSSGCRFLAFSLLFLNRMVRSRSTSSKVSVMSLYILANVFQERIFLVFTSCHPTSGFCLWIDSHVPAAGSGATHIYSATHSWPHSRHGRVTCLILMPFRNLH
jgi:hypothetical protein